MLALAIYYSRFRRLKLGRREALRRAWVHCFPFSYNTRRIELQQQIAESRKKLRVIEDVIIAGVWGELWGEKPRRSQRLVRQWRKETK